MQEVAALQQDTCEQDRPTLRFTRLGVAQIRTLRFFLDRPPEHRVLTVWQVSKIAYGHRPEIGDVEERKKRLKNSWGGTQKLLDGLVTRNILELHKSKDPRQYCMPECVVQSVKDYLLGRTCAM